MKINILALALAVTSPTVASTQLTSRERDRAQELARIQAKADADQRIKERAIRRDMAQAACRSRNRVWDYANEVCEPRWNEQPKSRR